MKGISNHFAIWTLISWEIVRGVFFLSVVLYYWISFDMNLLNFLKHILCCLVNLMDHFLKYFLYNTLEQSIGMFLISALPVYGLAYSGVCRLLVLGGGFEERGDVQFRSCFLIYANNVQRLLLDTVKDTKSCC